MKALFRFAAVYLPMALLLHAQETKVKCDDAFAAFEEKVNAGDFNAAYTDMPVLRKNCRGFNENVYRYSEIILNSKIETATAEERALLVNDLSALYTEYNTYYPKSDAAIKKAMLLYQHKLAGDQEVYALLDAAYANNRDVFTDHNAIETYFILYTNKFKEGNSSITSGDFVEKYGAVSEQVRIAGNKLKNQADELEKKQQTGPLTNSEKNTLNSSKAAIETLAAVGENIDILASKYLSCTKLAEYYANNYDKNSANVSWLTTMVNTLLANRCYTAEVLKKGALALHAIQPTPESAFSLASISQRNSDIKKAASYFEEAARLEKNNIKKADLYYRTATMYRAYDKAEAKKYILLSASHDPSSAKPHLFLAELYSSSVKDCGLSDFEQKALIWLAIEAVKKAETAEAKYKPTVASMVKSYTERLPSKQEVKAAGKKKGDKINYGCWINETVTIPNL